MYVGEPAREPGDEVQGHLGGLVRCGGAREPSVPDGATRCRIALLAFDQPPLLWRAASDLFANGFRPSQLCLFGSPHMMAELEPPVLGNDDFRQAFGDVISQPSARVRLLGAHTVEMKCGTGAWRLFKPVGDRTYEAEWLRPEFSISLASNVASGAAVLMLTSESAEQQARGARLLLRHGTYDLQTHEFSTAT
jgi:hypothetical protein